jgi:hypothetical protein
MMNLPWKPSAMSPAGGGRPRTRADNPAIEINPNGGYGLDMDNFLKGMNSVGQLFPSPVPYSGYPSQVSAWRGVANSFYQTGNSLRFAMKECSDARRKNKQTH